MSKIALDLDDTLGNHTEQFIAFYARVYNRRLKMESFTSYGLHTTLRISPDEVYGRLNRFYESPEFDAISPLPGAQECVQRLCEDGEELFLLTGRPKALKEKTKNWAKKYFPQIYPKNVLLSEELLPGPESLKGPICKKRSIDLIVEDSLEQTLSCSAYTGVALFTRPWNIHSPVTLEKNVVTRVETWQEVYALSKKY